MTQAHTPTPWAQGRLLQTRKIAERSEDWQKEANERERTMVFANFTAIDEGRSRIFIAKCADANLAAFIVKAANCHEDLVGALEDIIKQKKAWRGYNDDGIDLERANKAIVKAKGDA